ncbi:MAG: PilZ domain-containing protein [Candidatus Omnitrophota bacterium]
MSERRKNIRIHKSLIVRFKLPKGYLGMSSRSDNISEDGMRMGALQRFEPGMSLQLNFNLQEYTDPVIVNATVVWVDYKKQSYFPFVLGLRFINLADSDRPRLRDYISHVVREENLSISPGA